MPELQSFAPTGGWLVDGAIPKHSVCPFRVICDIAKKGLCKHRSYEHNMEYSCANARALQIIVNKSSMRSLETTAGGVRQG